MHTNYLFLIVCGAGLGVIFFYMLCETLIRLERRKSFNKSLRYKSSLKDGRDGIINLEKASAPPGGGTLPAGYILLPVHRTHPDEVMLQDGSDKVHQEPEDPRSDEAWKRQDSRSSEGGFSDRKEDPWITKNGTTIMATEPGSKHTEEGGAQKVGNPVTESSAEPNKSTVFASVEPVPPPASTFSTAGFWEAREAAKEAANASSDYDHRAGFISSGGGYDYGGESRGGPDSTNGWGGGSDYSTGLIEKEERDSSEL